MLWPDTVGPKLPMLSRWRLSEQPTGAKELGQIQLVFLELPTYDTSRLPQTMVEKWAYFFREAENLTVVPEVLAAPPFIDALNAVRIATFTVVEWDPYIRSRMAIQDKRGALAVARKRGYEEGLRRGREKALRQDVEVLCDVMRIELTAERKRELASLGAAELTALLARLAERQSWT